MGRDTIYGQFFAFLSGEKYIVPQTADLEHLTSTAACCILAMQHQTGKTLDSSLISWLKERQDETGGFRASEVAPVPDLLSTAVALFTLRLIGERLQSASRFIEAHWMDIGSFAPTLLDEYSDVEYLFYGLLALGSDNE
jgi:prenyltransferase beta subunit